MKKYRKTFDVNKIKRNLSYTVSDITTNLKVTKGTVYAWIREGLKPVDNNLPILIHGTELQRFLKERQNNRKSKCNLNEMFCLKCQQPRRALEGKSSLQTVEGRKPNLTGKCTVCNTQMNKAISQRFLAEITNFFNLVPPQDKHLIDSVATSTNHNNMIGE